MLSFLRFAGQAHRHWSSPLTQVHRLWSSSLLHVWRNPTVSLQSRLFHPSHPAAVTLNQATRRKAPKKVRPPKSPLLFGNTQKKGVVTSIYVLKPKKPNSAKRKVCRVRLNTGKTIQAYLPGEGHRLQEHNVVLVRGGRTQDLPGVRYKVVRGALDFGPVVNRTSSRSKYGAKKPKQ
ncbi:37S ribosomal protein S12, mitochondrial [Sparassis crispa]|uniref:37S ribosomal protein S12, mitochondrial n=1 Tax=Sparassis crispa TaxID=139825 RepID=A0A401GRW1_9APHY|nr:37S ribosomal protein S12, mitochondrial [Sparassis crispa]GBE84955.1 37S ribosomal protein S12, mitochondrial [Sparassis crispa]